MNVRKTLVGIAAACVLGAVAMATTGTTTYAAEKPEYLKSVTYFGDEWPINYWGSEDRYMDANFEKIKADGFNSIILVIPWREFQPNDGDTEFNQRAFDRLDAVMACAENHGLWVTVRIGYTWDYYGKAELPDRFSGVLKENGVDRYKWLRYCEKVYETVSKHSNFHSGFITWEDFWDYVHNMGREIPKKYMIQMAKDCGYQAYLEKNYSLEAVETVYRDEFESFSKVYIPQRKHPSAELFFDFFDQKLNDFLMQSQTVFPGLSMEVRADGDRVYDIDGNYYYYSHHATYPCEGAAYSALMYSVSMGQRNEYDHITAEQALMATERNLSALYGMSGKPFYVEQLLYMDSTEEFSHNTQIFEEETDAYVRSLAPILPQYTMGYGLWVYRNYVNNCVYNGQFGLKDEGWGLGGGCSIETVDGTPMARLGGKRRLTQKLTGRLAYREEIQVEMFVKPKNTNANVSVKIGDETHVLQVSNAGVYKFTLPWKHSYDIEIMSDKDAYVDDIKVYTYEQYGRIYDTAGNEQDLADDFRILNSQLQ